MKIIPRGKVPQFRIFLFVALKENTYPELSLAQKTRGLKAFKSKGGRSEEELAEENKLFCVNSV